MEELRISPIRNGTVIDHIPQGQSIDVLHILGIDESTRDTVSVAMNVPSEQMGKKDIVKVEGREIEEDEAAIIALIAPEVTVNMIREYDVVEKYEVSMPDCIVGILDCPNPNCITNTDEPVETRFNVVVPHEMESAELQCHYCETVVKGDVTDLL